MTVWLRRRDGLKGVAGAGVLFLLENQIQIAGIDDQAAALAGDENRVCFVDRIGQQNHTAADAEIPEGQRNDAFADDLALEPLNDEPGGEQRLPEKPDQNPDVS